ncbi:MAG: radical SAM protein [Candidatus Hadarchaeales archaeon]
MVKIKLPEPVSGGIFLSYKCSSECRHCMYACSPRWQGDWMSEETARRILASLADKIGGPIGINTGLHFTGGEPFLNFELLLKVVQTAKELGINHTFVETNCFWCTDDASTEEKLKKLKEAGLGGMLVSVNPFILEQVPFERTERAIKIGEKIFGRNLIIYQEFFYRLFKKMGVSGRLQLDEYLRLAGLESLRFSELLPMGRACYKLEDLLSRLYGSFPAEEFFSENCRGELLREWHVHIDNYGNYITGYCGGISMGNWFELLPSMELDLERFPVLDALINEGIGGLFQLAEKFGYRPKEGYVHKCHLCLDIRRYLIQRTRKFGELRPLEFYQNLL